MTDVSRSAIEEYIPYLAACRLLHRRFKATRDEIAMWVAYGSEAGGIDGYLDPSYLARYVSRPTGKRRPGRFRFCDDGSDLNYRSQVMKCYLLRNDVETFQPTDRFLTYREVIERWQGQLQEDEVVGLITARAATGALRSLHPVTGGTRGTPFWDKEEGFPPIEDGLFPLADVEAIEEECLAGLDPHDGGAAERLANAVSSRDIILSFQVLRDESMNEKWWTTRMRNAKQYKLLHCRAAAGRGQQPAYWYPDAIAEWLCAERPGRQHMSGSKAARILRTHFPSFAAAADLLDPGG